jgi:hypothetical protein
MTIGVMELISAVGGEHIARDMHDGFFREGDGDGSDSLFADHADQACDVFPMHEIVGGFLLRRAGLRVQPRHGRHDAQNGFNDRIDEINVHV